jgi:ArsR family transcriptional regulator, arsenate/arsenite/antimonite-responsive transcriptional repressor
MIATMRDLTKYFRALTSVSRLRIVEQLASAPGEVTVGELAVRLDMSQPLVSWHLRDLKRINLVQMRRTGRQALCSLNRGRLTHYQTLFAQLTKEHK